MKRCALWESRYLGEVFGRPFAERLPPWDDVLGLYARVGAHSDGTIRELPPDAAGRVPWWADPDVTLILIIANQLHETARQAGHVDILRELIDGAVGEDVTAPPGEPELWRDYCATIEDAARAAATRRY